MMSTDEEIYTAYEAELKAYYDYRKEATGEGRKGGRVYPKKVKEARKEWVDKSHNLLDMLGGSRTQLIEVIGRMGKKSTYIKR